MIKSSLAVRLGVWFLILSIFPLAILAIFVLDNVADGFDALALTHERQQTMLWAAILSSSLTPEAIATMDENALEPGNHVYVVDQAGHYRFHPQRERIGASIRADFSPPVVEQILSGRSDAVMETPMGRVIGFAPIAGQESILVCVHDNTLAQQLMASIRLSSYLQLGVGLVIIAFVGGMAIWIVVGKPVQQLTHAAEQIGRGNLSIRLDPEETVDELRILALTFNNMAAQLSETLTALRTLTEQLEQRVQERTAELEKSNQELESFTYSISHDLRSPLRSINGFTHILLDEYGASLPPESLQLFQRVRQSATRMGQLIDDLLHFSRLGRQPLQRRPVEMAVIIRQVIESLAEEQANRQVEWHMADLPPCQADPALLTQVWMNLLSNALKYTRSRSVARIEIGCRVSENGETIYHVRDNGVGFDMQYASKLFGVFQRLHSDAEFEGTGVGLALARRIVERHGGRMWAESAPDQGACFYFVLG
jgi:signal transduction histidine kinase